MNNYDKELKALDIFRKYPCFLPFVGSKYQASENKVLFIAESHYLPNRYNGLSAPDWYTKNLASYEFDEETIYWINTRQVMYQKPAPMYQKFLNVYAEVFEMKDYQEARKHIAFYNYFLRPSEKEGKTIEVKPEDSEIAFSTFLEINKILQPDKIIFVSKEAYYEFSDSFIKKERNQELKKLALQIDSVPYPSSPWWNKEMNVYGGLTGEQELIRILEDLRDNRQEYNEVLIPMILG